MEIAKGYCQCGCGGKTNIAKLTNAKWNHKKGEPVRFIHGHPFRLIKKGEGHHSWKGGVYVTKKGYARIYKSYNVQVMQHREVAENVLRKKLPEKAVLHHINGNKSDNRKCNLVVCENQAYHMLLHQRIKTKGAGGDDVLENVTGCHVSCHPD